MATNEQIIEGQESLMSQVTYLGPLRIGSEGEGRIYSGLETETDRKIFSNGLAENTKQLTHIHTMDCMDDRPTIALADGTSDPDRLKARIAPQWAGGLVLASTKALVAANAVMVRGAKNFREAYQIVEGVFADLGFEDGGHEKCGASLLVEESVAKPVDLEIAIPTTEAIIGVNESRSASFDRVSTNKARKLEEGFYSDWTASWHEDFLSQKYPQNFSTLRTAKDAVKGHYADGFYVVGKDHGFAKNAFYDATGKMSFAVTPAVVLEFADRLGGTKQERSDIAVAFVTDLLDVSDKLVAPGLPGFAEAA